MSAELERRVQKHEYEIETLKGGITEITGAVRDAVQSMDRLANTFSVYTTKHDNLDKTITEIKTTQSAMLTKQSQHGEEIAAIKPVAEALRKMVWGIAAGGICMGGGIAALIAAIPK